MEDDTRGHYDRLAENYNDNWVYSPEFIRWMTQHIVDRLDLRSADRVVDLGCGTGLYSKGLAERADQVLCVDPSAKMLEQIPSDERLIPVQASAEEVASGDAPLPYNMFDAVLIKEAIHHVSDQSAALHGLARMLTRNGRILVVMLPVRIDYPLFDAALELFGRLQPDPEGISDTMRSAGLRVDLQCESFGLSLQKAHYIRMVRSRYMSLLSSFDDAELERGIAEIDRSHQGDHLAFVDRHVFILGRR